MAALTRAAAWGAGAALLLFTAQVPLASTLPTLAGSWTGTVVVRRSAEHGTAACTLAQSGRTVRGAITVASTSISGTFPVAGVLAKHRVLLSGGAGRQHVRWRAHWSRTSATWRGPLVVGSGRHRKRAVLALVPDDGALPQCGGDYFATEVMPKVVAPICGQCHVPGGLAQGATFRVTIGDPAATSRSALRMVDPADPLRSRLLQKPLATLAHGGGQRYLPGGPEDQVLQHWVELVTAPGCGAPGGGGNGGTGAEIYAANCAACHGADTRGAQGRPDIHCTRSIADSVRSGRKGPAGDMPAFSNLSDTDIAAVQAFLDGLCPATTATGADLFASNCAVCHGSDATGTPGRPDIRCATRVVDAVRTGRGTAMPSIPALTDTDVALIDAYLGGLCTQAGRLGADLFAGNCLTCHGATATGGQNGLGVAGPDIHCQRSIATPVRAGQGTSMPSFPALADGDVAAIQQYLTASFCPAQTATGAELFTGNCATCHGADARGVDGNPNIRCHRAIRDPVVLGRSGPAGTMPAFPMSDAEIGRVQAYLVELCPAGSASGSDLYAAHCATCHAADGGGTSTAPSVRCATRVTNAVQVGRGAAMPAFPALAGSDLSRIGTFLAGLCVQYGRTGADLFAGNCAGCHGATAAGGRNGLGIRGPNIRCTEAHDYQEAVAEGADEMPSFPALGPADVNAISGYVLGAFCVGG